MSDLESGLAVGLTGGLCGDFSRSMVFCLELAVVASDTGCRGRELRSGGESFGGGDMTAARREPLEFCTGVLRAAAAEPVGVFDRVTGVLARVVGLLCCLDDLPLGGTRLVPAGELDRVDAGLAVSDGVPNFFVMTGSREDVWGEGDGSRRFRNCGFVLMGCSFDMACSLCDLPWFLVGLVLLLLWAPFF